MGTVRILTRVVKKTPEAARFESELYFSARMVLKTMEGIAASKTIIFLTETEVSIIERIKIANKGIITNFPAVRAIKVSRLVCRWNPTP